jgi:hypothetical protein
MIIENSFGHEIAEHRKFTELSVKITVFLINALWAKKRKITELFQSFLIAQ